MPVVSSGELRLLDDAAVDADTVAKND